MCSMGPRVPNTGMPSKVCKVGSSGSKLGVSWEQAGSKLVVSILLFALCSVITSYHHYPSPTPSPTQPARQPAAVTAVAAPGTARQAQPTSKLGSWFSARTIPPSTTTTNTITTHDDDDDDRDNHDDDERSWRCYDGWALARSINHNTNP